MATHTEAEEQTHEQRFIRAFFARSIPLTFSILAFNIAIYLLMTYFSPDPKAMLISGGDRSTLIAFGAKTDLLLWNGGQWFRLITPIFIHIGLLHLIINSYALFMIGPLAERLYGSARFAVIYLLTGIGGVLGSAATFAVPWLIFTSNDLASNSTLAKLARFLLQHSNPSATGAGASGAIFGLVGLLFVAGYKYRRELPPQFRQTLGSGMLPFIILNLFLGFYIDSIDNAAHMGGLITGIILALVIPYLSPNHIRLTRGEIVILIVCLLAVV
ncbi:MAG TPA: rhomboid family intramembrane serine protease, partial [Blastocatellia bacterium]|nr:rhomboid family intramembrane serine protease [Blastocatellia bacterium]